MADEELALEGTDDLFEEVPDEINDAEGDDSDDLEHFLNENKLNEHLSLFRDQQIDYETLMILTEPDLKSLGLPLGPFRKLINALEKKKNELHDDGQDEGVKLDKSKEDTELPPLTDENNFRVIDESGDDSDTHSVKSEHAGGKKKDDSKICEPDVNHPYKYDLMHFEIPDDMKIKAELQEPTTIDSKTFELITDERRLKNLVKSLRKEKILAVEAKHMDTFEKTLTIMQISTQTTDYIIDFAKMNQFILLMTDIFVNPNILKVFYDARHEVKSLQRFYNLFTINVYCVRSAVKELKYETTSLYGLINKYVSYFKPTDSECAQRPLKNDVKLNLRKETHYLLHLYYKTRNEAIEAGSFDAILGVGTRLCGYLHAPIVSRKPENLFTDFDKFNEAQKFAAEELNNWRESVAKDKNIDPNNLISVKNLKQMCLSLPIKKEEILAASETRTIRGHFFRLMAIMKAARKKYFNDPKDDTKYDLKPIETSKVEKNRPAPKASPKPKPKPTSTTNSPNVKPDLKRKNDSFTHPSPVNNKKPRFRSKKNFAVSKRNSFDKGGNKNQKPPFKNTGGYRGGFQGNNASKGFQGNSGKSFQGSSGGKSFSGNSGKNFQPNVPKYTNPQNIWASPQNQAFSNNYGGGGFKYY